MKSLVKRRLAVEPGRSRFPFDQIDYVIGAFAAGALFVRFPPIIIAATMAAYFVLHLMVSAIGYAVGIKTAPI